MPNPFQALWSVGNRKKSTGRQQKRRESRLVVESLESRRVLSASPGSLPSITGVVYADANDNGMMDAGEAVEGAQILLFLDDGDGVFEPGIDDVPAGVAQFTDENGEYCFDNLDQNEDYWVVQPAQTVEDIVLEEQVSALIECEPQLIIDEFITTQSTAALPPPVSNDESALVLGGTEVLGGERDLAVELSSGTSEVQLRVNPFGLSDVLLFDSSAGTTGLREVTWDGLDNDGDALGLGLGGIDLTQGGELQGITALMGVDANGANARFRIYQGSTGNFSEATVLIPVTGGTADEWVFIPFSDFAGPVDASNVDAVQLFIDTGNDSVDGQIDTIGVLGPKVADFENEVVVDLELVKSVDASMVNNGDVVTWTLSITNNETNATSPASGVVVSDVLPSGVTFVNANTANGSFAGNQWTLADPLAPGDTATLTVMTTIDAGVTGGTVLTNVAEVTAQNETDFDSVPDNDDGDQSEDDEDNASVTLGEFIDLEVTKTSNVMMVNNNDQVTFTVTVSNNDENANADATGVVVSDPLPSGLTLVSATPSAGTFVAGDWTLGSPLAPGASETLMIVASVDPDVPGDTKITNVAQVTAANETDDDSVVDNDDGDQSEDDESGVMLMVGQIIDLELTKTVDQSVVEPGDTVNWTIEVTNNPATANSDATNVEVTDVLPAGVTFVSATPSGSGTFAGGVWSLVDPLAPGATATLILTSTVNAGIGGSDLINAAQVTAADQSDFDSTPNNDDGDRSEDEEDEAQIQLARIIDLEIEKAANSTMVLAGTPVTFTITLTNNATNANADATGVTVTDVLPTGLSLVNSSTSNGSFAGTTWTLANPLAPGASATLTLVADVSESAPDSIENVVQVASANEIDFDSMEGNDDGDQSEDDEDNVVLAVTPLAIDLELTKDVDSSTVLQGDQVTFTISLTNNPANANTDATGVTVTDLLPTGLSLVTSSADNGSFNGGTWTLANPLAPGATANLTLVAEVSNTAPTTLENVAQVASANEMDIDSVVSNDDGDQSEDDEDNVVLTVTPLVIDLELTKTANGSNFDVGDQVTFTISLTNNPANANTAATGVTVTDTLPAGLSFVSANPSNGTFAGSVWTLGSPLAPGATETLNLVATVESTAGLSAENVAQVSAANENDIDSVVDNDNGDQSEDDEDNVVLSVNPQVIDLELTKSVSASEVSNGEQVTWTISLTNNAAVANSAATGVRVTDTLPAGLTLQSSSPSSGTFSGGVWTLGGPIAPGQTETLNLVTVVDDSVAGGEVLVNVAQVSAANENDIDSTPNNDNGDQSEDEEDNARITVPAVVDLDIDKSVDQNVVNVGDTLTWTVTVRNDPLTGNTAATGVVVDEVLPAGVTFVSSNATNGSYNSGSGIWTLAAPLAPGQSATLTVVTTVDEGASGSNLENVAQVLAADQTDVDSIPANDDGDQSEDDEDPEEVRVAARRPLSKRDLLASAG